jgi:hypothetical protein
MHSNMQNPAPMQTLYFRPLPSDSGNYQIVPESTEARSALSVILAYGSLPVVAKAALQRGEYGETNRGLGLEYPTRPDRAEHVRLWYWQWRTRKGKSPKTTNTDRLVTRKFYIAERLYLAVLVGVLECRGYSAEAQAIRATKPLAEITVEYSTDIYRPGNYKIVPYSAEASLCLHIALIQHDLEKTRQHARDNTGFVASDNSWLNFHNYYNDELRRRELSVDGQHYTWHSGNRNFEHTTTEVNRELYLHVLEQLLYIHGFDSLYTGTIPYPKLHFVPRVGDWMNFRVAKACQDALEVILSWPRLEQVAEIAVHAGEHYKPRSYININRVGAELRDDDVLLYFGTQVQVIAKERYLAVLAGVLRACGHTQWCERIEQTGVDAEPVQWQPQRYWRGNHHMMPFDSRVWRCLDVLLSSFNFFQDEESLEGVAMSDLISLYHQSLLSSGDDGYVSASFYTNLIDEIYAQ